MFIVFGTDFTGHEYYGVGNTLEDAISAFKKYAEDDHMEPDVYFKAEKINVTKRIEYIID